QYHRRTDALARAMRRLGVEKGDRVAIVSGDCVEVAESFGACMKLGAIRVGLNARLAPAEIVALAADCNPRIIFVSSENQKHLENAKLADSSCRIVSFGDSPKSEYEEL